MRFKSKDIERADKVRMNTKLAFFSSLALLALLLLGSDQSLSEAAAAGRESPTSKVFNYEGYMPIKDDRTGELVREDGAPVNETSSQALTDAEEACWKLINEQSGELWNQKSLSLSFPTHQPTNSTIFFC